MKKSKEQTKFRYKYYNYLRQGDKAKRHIKGSRNEGNPELQFLTLAYH